MEEKEYIITLKNFDDLDQFYEDMESICNKDGIPNRKVECVKRREISRNTHYYLTDDEAKEIIKDDRVLDIRPTLEELGLKIIPFYTIDSSYWDKSSSSNSNYKNWGLIRCLEGTQTSNWGGNITSNRSASGKITSSGKNVDVVIIDGHMNPAHPEYAVNSDGTGGSRVIQYNWYQHSLGQSSSNYIYPPYTGGGTSADADNNHGAHVAGTIAGNSQGWARSANIYNISPYSTNPNGNIGNSLIFDYVRAFHNNKSVNPVTGRKNPTITNNSWGISTVIPVVNISFIRYRGSIINGPFSNSSSALSSYGILTSYNSSDGLYYAVINYRDSVLEADMTDAANDGIINVGAAGNSFYKIDVSSGLDYNNYAAYSGYAFYYHRGSSPGSASACICVGAVSNLANEVKASFSNCGPRIDVYSPGQYIMSSLNGGGVQDLRNASYTQLKYSGTSMASPQVCGVLACLLEQHPNFTQADALDYLTHYAKNDQLYDSGGGYSDSNSLQGSQNRYLFYKKERPSEGLMYPRVNFRFRNSAKIIFPRKKIKIK